MDISEPIRENTGSGSQAHSALSSDRLCELCSTPIPWVQRRRKGKASRFCCSGCLHVYEILAVVPPDQGGRIMDQARRLGILPNQQSLPEEALRAEKLAESLQGMDASDQKAVRSDRCFVEGYACPSCAWLVEVVLLSQAGVRQAQADFMSDSVLISYDMRRTSPTDLSDALLPFGYRLHPIKEGACSEEARLSRLLRQFVLALLLALNVMMLSSVHWSSYLESIPILDLKIIALIQAVLTMPLIGLGVWPLARRGTRLLRMGKPSMDLLFVLGFTAAFFLSVAGFVHEGGEFYFDSCAAFVAISLLGRVVEARLRYKAVSRLRALWDMPAKKAAVLGGPVVSYRSLEQVEVGAEILVEPGQVVPLDGVCQDGPSLVSEAMLTGEPAPVLKRLGDLVWAGSTPVGHSVSIRVTRPYQESRLQQIADSVARALGRGELRLRSADRLAGWFVPAVLLVASVTFVLRFWLTTDAVSMGQHVWMPTIAVLLVACPCAFGIAAASVLAVAVSALLEKGVLVMDSSVLERLDNVDSLVFDKTGTLTTGVWALQEIRWFQKPDLELLALVAGAEAEIDHPVACTLVTHLVQELGIKPLAPDEIDTIPGRGVCAKAAGRKVVVGSSALFASPPRLKDVDDRTSVVFFGYGHEVAGSFMLTDVVRKEAGSVVDFFRRRKMDICVLSGDRQPVVEGVARRLGINRAYGGLSPEEKRDRIQRLAGDGCTVCYVGDGSNDGPAMAESAAAISLRKGSKISMSAAHVLPLADRLTDIPRLFRAGKLTNRTMWWNFTWALVYNLVFLPLAALGYLHPIFAAGLMFVSSITVLVNSLRLKSHVDKAWLDRKGSSCPH